MLESLGNRIDRLMRCCGGWCIVFCLCRLHVSINIYSMKCKNTSEGLLKADLRCFTVGAEVFVEKGGDQTLRWTHALNLGFYFEHRPFTMSL